MAMQGELELRVTIPDGVDFADLHLSRDLGHTQVRVRVAPIEAIWEASDLNLGEILHSPQPPVGQLIAAWYAVHLERGGAPDAGQEDLLGETRLEMEQGGGFSYALGHA